MSGVLWTRRKYPCGCAAVGDGDIPAYCAEHGKPPDSPVNRLLRFVESVQAQSYQTLWEVTKDAPSEKDPPRSLADSRNMEVRKILGFNDARSALEDLLLMVEQGWLVRDIRADYSDATFWPRAAQVVERLAKARNALIRMNHVRDYPTSEEVAAKTAATEAVPPLDMTRLMPGFDVVIEERDKLRNALMIALHYMRNAGANIDRDFPEVAEAEALTASNQRKPQIAQ